MPDDTTRVHLQILGQPREIEIPTPRGSLSLTGILPMARAMSARATAIAVEAEQTAGRRVSCQAGCAACCRQFVPISVVEARAIADAVAALPPDGRAAVRARFDAVVTEMERLGLIDPDAPPGRMILQSSIVDPEIAWRDVTGRYFAAQIPCPLLDDDRCSIYEDRPIVCREYLVTSPKDRCSNLDGGARVVPRPVRGSEAIATAVREYTGEALPMLPLPLSIEWSRAKGAMLDRTTDGENLVNHLVAAADLLTGG